jgi:hypothetical protein
MTAPSGAGVLAMAQDQAAQMSPDQLLSPTSRLLQGSAFSVLAASVLFSRFNRYEVFHGYSLQAFSVGAVGGIRGGGGRFA